MVEIKMVREPYSIIAKVTPIIPLIAHIPHGSTFIPEEVRRSIVLNDSDLIRELLLMTDRYTPELFEGIVASGGLAIVNNYSRLVFDPERFEDDQKEPMASRGMGAIYTKTSHQQILRKTLTPKQNEEMLSTYYRPYHEAIEAEVGRMMNQFDHCLIIDCHSFSSKPLPCELDQSPYRPDICIGTDLFHTPNELIALVRSFWETNGMKVAIDRPFAGTYVPLTYLSKDKRISSIMIEVNRRLYMDEETGAKSFQFYHVQNLIDGLISKLFKPLLPVSA